MRIQRLPADEAAVRCYVTELWVPYSCDLETTIDAFALATGVDLVDEQTDFTLEKLESTDYQIQVVIDPTDDPANGDENVDFIDGEGDLVGFIATDYDPCPSVFDRPNRTTVCDLYVSEPYRGTGLAHELIKRAEGRARAEDCSELVLSVDVDNERALRFYEKLSFEPLRHRMIVDVASPDKSE
jgi:ribosomal protein S18 acetylase RimI-like enzyme